MVRNLRSQHGHRGAVPQSHQDQRPNPGNKETKHESGDDWEYLIRDDAGEDPKKKKAKDNDGETKEWPGEPVDEPAGLYANAPPPEETTPKELTT